MTLAGERRSCLEFRDALHEWDHVPSIQTFQGSDTSKPLLTIAITTFKRQGFLLEALASVLDQKTRLPYEIIVLDNDPDSSCLAHVLEKRPELRDRNFRYYVNAENIGMYGNINRCVPLARGAWLSILHDDDLLRDDFIEVMLTELGRYKRAHGIVPAECIIDQRNPPAQLEPETVRRLDTRYMLELVLEGPKGWSTLFRRLHSRLVAEAIWRQWFWMGKSSRRIGPATLFLGPVLGNGSGFIFRTEVAKQCGGFYPEEFPASDLTFYARFAARYHLRQHRLPVCFYRVAENESLQPDTARGALIWIHQLQKDLAGVYVPRWFLRLAPAIMEHWRTIYRTHWRIDIPKAELERLLGLILPEDRPELIRQLRLLLKGI